MTKRKGKYVIRSVWGSFRLRLYFTNKKEAIRFRKLLGIKAAIRENV